MVGVADTFWTGTFVLVLVLDSAAFEPASPFRHYVRIHVPYYETCVLARLVCIALTVEDGRRQALGSVEGELSVASQRPRGSDKPVEILEEPLWQPAPLRQQNLGDVMDARRVHANASQKTLESEFDNFVRLTDHLRPVPVFVQDIDRPQSRRYAPNMVFGECLSAHQPPSSLRLRYIGPCGNECWCYVNRC